MRSFLNSKGTHGLKYKLLESFVESLGEYFTINTFNCEKASVFTEYTTEAGRIDILIEDNDNKAIIIENKIYAKDQLAQFKRYDQFAQKYKNGHQILYLTLFGQEASSHSGEGIAYLRISHKDNIINWLEKCVSIASRFPIVRESVIQYINHLKQLTNQDMDSKNKEEMTDILSNIENKKAAKVIYQNYAATYKLLAEKHFNREMQEFAKEKDLDYHYEDSNEAYIKFYLTSPKWKGKFWVGFTYEQNRCFYGLCNDFKTYRVADEERSVLQQNLQNLRISGCKQSDWWPFYAYYPNLTIEAWENNIVKSSNFANDCKEKINTLLRAMKDCIGGFE